MSLSKENSIISKYNILKNAYSLLGFKHSDENIARFKLKSISSLRRACAELAQSLRRACAGRT